MSQIFKNHECSTSRVRLHKKISCADPIDSPPKFSLKDDKSHNLLSFSLSYVECPLNCLDPNTQKLSFELSSSSQSIPIHDSQNIVDISSSSSTNNLLVSNKFQYPFNSYHHGLEHQIFGCSSNDFF